MNNRDADRIMSKKHPTLKELEAVGKHLRLFKEQKAKKPRSPPIMRWSTKRNDACVFAALDALRQAGREILAKKKALS